MSKSVKSNLQTNKIVHLDALPVKGKWMSWTALSHYNLLPWLNLCHEWIKIRVFRHLKWKLRGHGRLSSLTSMHALQLFNHLMDKHNKFDCQTNKQTNGFNLIMGCVAVSLPLQPARLYKFLYKIISHADRNEIMLVCHIFFEVFHKGWFTRTRQA